MSGNADALVVPANAGTQLGKFFIKINPSRIGLLDWRYLPGTSPSLDGFLAYDGAFHCGISLVPYQSAHSILFGESFNQLTLVQADALGQIGGHSAV